MDLTYILENKELSKLLSSSIGKTYNRYHLSFIIELEDFEQEVYCFIIPRLKNFDEEKSSLKTYIPLMVMSRAKQLITLANGQCKDKSVNKLNFNNSILSLDCEIESSNSNIKLGDAVGESLDNSDIKLVINEIINLCNLTEKQKTIIILMSKGFTISDIAKIQNKSQSCINITFQRAREKIVKKYDLMI